MKEKDSIRKLSPGIEKEIKERVARGEFKSGGDLIETALRYYFERHPGEEWDRYIRKEIDAGLRMNLDPGMDPILEYIGGVSHGSLARDIDSELYGDID